MNVQSYYYCKRFWRISFLQQGYNLLTFHLVVGTSCPVDKLTTSLTCDASHIRPAVLGVMFFYLRPYVLKS